MRHLTDGKAVPAVATPRFRIVQAVKLLPDAIALPKTKILRFIRVAHSYRKSYRSMGTEI